MALEDFMEPEVGIAIAATAALSSPKVREVARRGMVYGLAGAMMAGDFMMSFAQGVARGAKQAAGTADMVEEVEIEETETPAEDTPAAPRRARPRRSRPTRGAAA
ncbi:MAG: hypothetical protein JOZ57_11445 [Abitibacteriaceae bacterium]|nr:hypothetical protein [Abditibacteriaceae bacterium]